MKILAAFIIGFGVTLFHYWAGGGDFTRGDELEEYCWLGMTLGAVAALMVAAITNPATASAYAKELEKDV